MGCLNIDYVTFQPVIFCHQCRGKCVKYDLLKQKEKNNEQFMSCHVIVRNRFIPFHRVAGCCCWIQSQPSPGEGRVLPRQVASSSQHHGVQYLAQGHFNMQLSPARSPDLNQHPFDH